MKLRRVRIENFRGIKHLELELDETTVLIGENNSGKTSVLDAIRLCMSELGGRRRLIFEPYDFHLKEPKAEPSTAEAICIELTFAEDSVGDWPDATVSSLTRLKVLQVDGEGRSHAILRVRCAYNAASREFEQSWSFLDMKRAELLNVPESALGALQREVSYHYFSALRDAARHFDPKGPFWRPFLNDSQLPDEKREEIERKLKEVNSLVIDSHKSFEQVRHGLKTVQDVVPMTSGDVVSIEAVPGRLFDMLAKANVHLSTAHGAQVPVGRHGEGTQSLAVLLLFSAFLKTWGKGTPIVALEEPEAHLHPSAIRALWGILESVSGQKIVSTHSGDLLSEVDVTHIRRLVRGSKGIELFRLNAGTLTPYDERKFNFHIRYGRGELLFARCWILVEGETEMTLLPGIARHLGINLERSGIRCVPHRHAGIELFLKVARDLGIRWCVLADNDDQGNADQKHARAYGETLSPSDILHVMSEPDIEQYLCSVGFGSVYEAYLSPQNRGQVTLPKEDPGYWKQVTKAIKGGLSKPEAAMKVLTLISSGDAPVPPLLEATIRASVRLAEGVAPLEEGV